eukprot:2420488-Amphidinium_carterae.3
MRRVEEHEASLREIEVMVTRERHSYYEELVQSLPTTPVQTSAAQAPAPWTAAQLHGSHQGSHRAPLGPPSQDRGSDSQSDRACSVHTT